MKELFSHVMLIIQMMGTTSMNQTQIGLDHDNNDTLEQGVVAPNLHRYKGVMNSTIPTLIRCHCHLHLRQEVLSTL